MQTAKNLKNLKKAMIFAAGLGTRLKPVTNHQPKALAEINGVTLLEILIRKLIQNNYHNIVVNVHHFANQVIDFIKQKNSFGINIMISDESDLLLDTGGGIQKAAAFLQGNAPVLLHNVDVLTNIDLQKMEDYHNQQNAFATLAIRDRSTSRYLLFNDHNRLIGWQNIKTREKIMAIDQDNFKMMAFSGVHFINPAIFNLLKKEGPYSIIKLYLELASDHKIIGYPHDHDLWMDLGKPEHLSEASKNFEQFYQKS